MTTAPTTRPANSAAASTAASAELAALPAVPPSSDTPRRLRRYQLITALAVLVLGLIGVAQLTQLRADLSSAPSLGVQHIRLGELSAAISMAGNQAAADALTDAGTDQATQLLTDAAALLVEAASAEPAQAAAISEINVDLLRYGQLLSAAQFDQADEVLSSSLQPAIDSLGQSLSSGETGSWWTSPVLSLGFGLIVLVGLCWLSYQVAQRSHRVLNSGLLAAMVATVAITGFAAGGTPASGGAGLSSTAVIQASSQLTDAQLQADSATRALLQAVRHKSWDTAAQDAFAAADQRAGDDFVADAADLYAALQSARKPVTTALASGNWAKAGTLLATDGAAAKAEAALNEGIADQRSALRADATADPATDSVLFAFEVGAAVLALAGAFLGARGLQTRIEEYR